MKNLFYIFLLLSFVAISQSNYAQFKEWGTKFGVRYNQLFPENEFQNVGFGDYDDFSFDTYKFSYLVEGFIAFELTKALELQLNAGYGSYAGDAVFLESGTNFGEYETQIIPVSLRFRVSPWDMKGWNPYFYFGGGVMNYNVETYPSVVGKPVEDNGWVGIIPAGIGSEFAISENVLFDFAIGGAMSTTYDLDGQNSGAEDNWDYYLNASAGLTFTGESCSSDRDGDGLGKCDEEKLGTDPRNADTDGDGFNDGDEVLKYKTDPLKVDSDSDGLNDNDEIMTYKTNPLVADTDGDGLTDGDEVIKHKTDPLFADSDKDSLNDGVEISQYKTNPLSADTDKDGLTDGDEVLKYKTDPLKADTDGDGLTDSEEVIKHKTDPNKKDTDGGTVDDGTEVKRGTDPLNAEDDVVKVGVPIILEGITFAIGKADITPESENTLRKALKTLTTYTDISVEISGHTDNVGSEKSNQILSEKRANSVRDWLVREGIEPGRINAVGYGESRPTVPNDTKENMQKNRRIEFTRTK